MKDNEQLFCSFCGKPKELAKRLIAGPNGIFICDECVEVCREVMKEDQAKDTQATPVSLLKPIEIKAKLDEYIVEKERIEDYIENIEDAEVRVIARKRFIENKDYQTIGDEMYIDRTTAYKKLKRYFERTEEE